MEVFQRTVEVLALRLFRPSTTAIPSKRYKARVSQPAAEMKQICGPTMIPQSKDQSRQVY